MSFKIFDEVFLLIIWKNIPFYILHVQLILYDWFVELLRCYGCWFNQPPHLLTDVAVNALALHVNVYYVLLQIKTVAESFPAIVAHTWLHTSPSIPEKRDCQYLSREGSMISFNRFASLDWFEIISYCFDPNRQTPCRMFLFIATVSSSTTFKQYYLTHYLNRAPPSMVGVTVINDSLSAEELWLVILMI